MSQQPIPTVGSIVFLVHIAVIVISWLKKRPIIIVLIILLLTGVFSARYIYGNSQRQKLESYTSTQKNHKDEKTEPITDINFVKDQRFAAWVPWWDEDRVITSLQNSHGALQMISPVWYVLGPNGTLQENPTKQKEKIKDVAINSGIVILPTINNENGDVKDGFDPKRVSLLLNNKSLQQAFINNLTNVANEQGFIGWDIDWELKNKDEELLFTEFIKDLSEQLHKNNLLLSVSVQAKTEDDVKIGDTKGENWTELSKYADEVRIMAYDFHYDQSDPGSLTPLDDLETVLDYAVKVIPPNKIVLGIPLYGYDWGSKTESVQFTDAIDRIQKNGGTYVRDTASEELVGNYRQLLDKHTVWFTDKTSVLRILYIASNYDVQKISFWRLGGEDPEIWKLKQ